MDGRQVLQWAASTRRPQWDLGGAVTVITGAGSGIGRALAVEAARRGARLAISDVNATGLAETESLLAEEGALGVHSGIVDVSDRHAIADHAAQVMAHYGVVNLCINNAGVAFTGGVNEAEYADIARIVDIDYWGVVHGTKEFLPHLIASGDGHLVNISSIFSVLAVPGQSAYNSAKAGVAKFTEALGMEMRSARRPVAVSCVLPGGIRTAIARSAHVAEGLNREAIARTFDSVALMDADRAARIILNGVQRRKPRIVVGADAHLMDLAVRTFPATYQRVIPRLMPSNYDAHRSRR